MEEIFSRNFIEESIDKDLEEKVYDMYKHVFLPNLTVIFISDTQRL